MNNGKEIDRIIDWKNSQTYVRYTDGSYGFKLSFFVPAAIKQAYLDAGGKTR
jgi:hypothetical protein